MVSTAREYHAPIGHQHFRWHISFLTQHFHDGLPIGKLSGNMLLEQIKKSNIVSQYYAVFYRETQGCEYDRKV